MAYDKLFEPGYIGKVKIKNRLVGIHSGREYSASSGSQYRF